MGETWHQIEVQNHGDGWKNGVIRCGNDVDIVNWQQQGLMPRRELHLPSISEGYELTTIGLNLRLPGLDALTLGRQFTSQFKNVNWMQSAAYLGY